MMLFILLDTEPSVPVRAIAPETHSFGATAPTTR